MHSTEEGMINSTWGAGKETKFWQHETVCQAQELPWFSPAKARCTRKRMTRVKAE